MAIDLGMFTPSRIHLVRQTEIAECGLACLTMIANFHGLATDLHTMRRRFAPSRRGAGLRTLIDICSRIGLSARAVGLSLSELPNLHMPAILHWDMRHFVVVERVRRDSALIHNPDGRSTWMKLSDVSGHFTGAALEIRPGVRLEAAPPRKRLRLAHLWSRITGLTRALVQTALLSLVLQVFILASPYYMQVAVDRALPALDASLLVTLALGFGVFAIINSGAALLRGFVMLSAGTSLGFGIATNIARHLFRLPVAWFENRQSGDILSRFQSIAPIQQMLTEGAVASLVDGVLAVTTLTVMFFYSPTLTAIAIAALVLVTLTRLLSFSLLREASEAMIVTAGKEQTTLIESMRGIVTLRMFGQEMQQHATWQSRRVDATNANVRVARINIWQGIANSLIFGIETVLSIWLAVRLVMNGGGFSVGMVFAYLAYKTQFIQKAESLVEQAVKFRMLGLHLERLSDIALSEEDRSFGENEALETKLQGRLELRDVYFQYSPADPFVLSGVNLRVEPGEHIAITGPSGGGKSTLVKILLGLVEPAKGEVLIDDLPLSRFGYRSYHRQASGILQNDTLFAGTLAENIASFDEGLDMPRVIAAATAASIHADIMEMPMQYETLVGEMGSSLSGGQKQRVILARALYRKPMLLIIDEGTAHLDAVHEAAINQAVRAMGITRIIIAHRRETIAAADRVFCMNGGRLTELPPTESPARATCFQQA